MAEDKTKVEPVPGSRDDKSGQGRPRKDDSDVFPARRGADEFGTHGGPKHKNPSSEDEQARK